MINWVQQEDKYGCTVAAVAMVVGKTYQEVRSYFTIDFSKSGAILEDWHDYLFDNGFICHRTHRFLHLKEINLRKPVWPPEPFAPIHICNVINEVSAHAVVMLENGDVLDPAWPGVHKLTDYKEVYWVTGCWKRP